jgi:hypothetical protein
VIPNSALSPIEFFKEEVGYEGSSKEKDLVEVDSIVEDSNTFREFQDILTFYDGANENAKTRKPHIFSNNPMNLKFKVESSINNLNKS